jgi:hypothetical protein
LTNVAHIVLRSWLYERMAILDKYCAHCTKIMVVQTNGYT